MSKFLCLLFLSCLCGGSIAQEYLADLEIYYYDYEGGKASSRHCYGTILCKCTNLKYFFTGVEDTIL